MNILIARTNTSQANRPAPAGRIAWAGVAGLGGVFLATGLLVFLGAATARAAASWYVAPTGSDSASCGTLAQPCATLQYTFNKTAAGDTVFVATGTYIGSGDQVALIDHALTLSGGWNSSFTTQAGSSTVDGQNARRGVTIGDDAPTSFERFTVQNGLATSGAYTSGAGIAAGAGSPVTLTDVTLQNNTSVGGGTGLLAESSVTITRGLVQGNTCSGVCYGAGVSTGGSARVDGTSFINNTGADRGGALDVFMDLVILNASFTGNNASGFGGAVYVNQSVLLTDTVFTSNSTNYQGGALYSFGHAHLTRPIVEGNTAFDEGGGLAFNATATVVDGRVALNVSQIAAGGGIASAGAITLTRTDLLTNTAVTRGGGITARAGLTMVGGTVRANAADQGGGIALGYSTGSSIQGATIVNNAADQQGGGILIASTVLTASTPVSLDNNVIAANSATSQGAELALFGPGAAAITGRHNTFSARTAGAGTGVTLANGASGDSLNLTNAIFAGYSVGVQAGAQSATASLTGVLWSSVTQPTQTSNSAITVSGAVTGAASFVNSAGYDFHIADGSAAYNQGVATALTTDIDGETRPLYGVADLGADELNLATDLALTKRVSPANAAPGDAITYTLTYTNVGTRVGYAPIITDVVPTASLTNIAFTSSGAAITATPGLTYTWSVANLAPGAGGTITITADVRDPIATPLTVNNSATIESWVGDPTLGNNTGSAALAVNAPIAGLAAQSTSPQPPGTPVFFTATVTAGTNVTYAWSFGNGGTATGATPNRTYAAIGVYTAVVTATNPLGSSSVSIPVTIADTPISGLAITGPLTPSINTPTAYAASATTGSNLLFAWSTDHGQSGSGSPISLTFPTLGSHTITVTATNTTGSQTVQHFVTVVPVQLYLTLIARFY